MNKCMDMIRITEKNAGKQSLIAIALSSLLLTFVFGILSIAFNQLRDVPLYSNVDIVTGMLFVLMTRIIVFASVWPVIIEKLAR